MLKLNDYNWKSLVPVSAVFTELVLIVTYLWIHIRWKMRLLKHHQRSSRVYFLYLGSSIDSKIVNNQDFCSEENIFVLLFLRSINKVLINLFCTLNLVFNFSFFLISTDLYLHLFQLIQCIYVTIKSTYNQLISTCFEIKSG